MNISADQDVGTIYTVNVPVRRVKPQVRCLLGLCQRLADRLPSPADKHRLLHVGEHSCCPRLKLPAAGASPPDRGRGCRDRWHCHAVGHQRPRCRPLRPLSLWLLGPFWSWLMYIDCNALKLHPAWCGYPHMLLAGMTHAAVAVNSSPSDLVCLTMIVRMVR